MASPSVPISIHLSPSTYMLLLKLIDLCVDYDPVNEDLKFRDGATPGAVQTAIDTFFNALRAANTPPPAGIIVPTLAELQQLQQDGLKEAEAINKGAGYAVTMPC